MRLITDENVDKLEDDLLDAPGKPDARRRRALAVIDRMRVAERALRILAERTVDAEMSIEVAQRLAVEALKREGVLD